MAYNGSGTFNIDSTGQPVVATTLIEAATFNAFTADIGTGLSTAITKDGQTTITANIPFNTKKITGLGSATTRTDATNLGNIQDGTGVYVSSVGGTADVITLSPTPSITAYTAGQTFRFIASGANTTNVTVNVSSLGAKAITKHGTTALQAGDIASGAMVTITYDGTEFVLAATNLANFTSPTITTPTITGGTITQVPITQNSQSAAYELVLADGGKHILHPSSDDNPRTFTIPSNASVGYAIGTIITVVNEINTVTIAITSDTLTLAEVGTTGSRTLAVNGMATLLKIGTTKWIISGAGLS